MPLSPDQILNHRYRIVRLLAQGGFGAVYVAWDLNLERFRALKENLDITPKAQSQFKREAQILSDLTHPNLPKVIDHFVIPEQGQYLVMEYIEGQDLREVIRQRAAPVSESQAVDWIIQICSALEYLHTQDQPVIHRDIKPANIKITPQGKAILVDFGIAKFFNPEQSTTAGARAISSGFSPIEQYGSGSRTDARSDIYGLGTTLYYLLTAQTPPDALERNLGEKLPLPVAALNPAVSAQMEAAILQATAIMPDQRFKSATDFKNTLLALAQPYLTLTLAKNGFAEKTSIRSLDDRESFSQAFTRPDTVPDASTPPTESHRRRKRLLAGAGAILAIATLAILAVAILKGFSGEDEAVREAALAENEALTLPAWPSLPNVQPTITSPSVATFALETFTPVPSLTPILNPKLKKFTFCDRPCSEIGAVILTHFSSGTTDIYFSYEYTGMQQGIEYVVYWSNRNEEWLRYRCTWQGGASGAFYGHIGDSAGLRSGIWSLKIVIDQRHTFRASAKIDGASNHWLPPGVSPCPDW